MADISALGMIFLNTSVYGGVPDSYWTVMMEDISAALQRRGDDHICINPDMDEHRNMLKMMVLGGFRPRYLLQFNFAPAFARADDPSQLGVLGGIKAPYYSLFLDHPSLLGTRIAEMEALIAGSPELRSLRRYGLMEEGHRSIMERMGVPRSACFLFPQAGGLPVAAPRPLEQRSITAVFAGTVAAATSHQTFCDEIGMNDAHCRRLADQAVSEAMDSEDDVYPIVERVFADTELIATVRGAVELTRRIDYRARTLRRHRMFACLRHLPISFFGNASDDFKRDNKNVEFRGPIGFRRLLDVMDDARIMLNDTINLRSSTLIRVFYGMSRGCLVASEKNAFIEGEFIRPGAALPVDCGDASAGERILNLVNRPVEAQEMVGKASRIYAQAHTWDHRLPTLLSAMAA